MINKQGTEKLANAPQGDTPEWEKKLNQMFDSFWMCDCGNYSIDSEKVKSLIRTVEQKAREEGYKDAENTFYAVMHTVRAEAGKNQLLILSKVSNMFRSLINQRGK